MDTKEGRKSNVRVTFADENGNPVDPNGVEGYRYIADRLNQAWELLNYAEMMPMAIRAEVFAITQKLGRVNDSIGALAAQAERHGVEWALNERDWRKEKEKKK